jgi:hypothetical protein
MNLIIIFTKIESHTNFNGANTIDVNVFMNEMDEEYNLSSFGARSDHFHRLLPYQPIIGNTFGTNTEGFKNINAEHSEVLLIQLYNNIEDWKEGFGEDFKKYAAQFDSVFISYHLGQGNCDIDNGNHRLIEDFIEQKEENKLIWVDKYSHILSTEIEPQLYGFFAKSIVDNNGVFDEPMYTNLVEKLLSFIEIKDSKDKNEIQLILDCKTNIGTKYLSEKSKEYCIKTIANYESLITTDAGIKDIHDILDKRIIKL